jgi:CRISPR-associated protein Csb2
VPDNVGDRVAASWVRGGVADIAEFRTEKDVRAMRLDSDTVHFMYALVDADGEFAKHRATLQEAAESITHLGWGIDMVAANAVVLDAVGDIAGEQWHPVQRSAKQWRAPIAGTLQSLIARHEAFLNRLDACGFNPVPALSAYQPVGYRRGTDTVRRPFASFSITRPDGNGYRPFEPARHGRTVAGMMRGTAAMVATDAGWPATKVAAIILGHGEAEKEAHKPVGPQRFAFLPLPSIEGRGPGKPRVVGSIRRVLVTAFADGCEAEIAWAKRALPNQPLVDEKSKEQVALLASLPASDWIVCQYTGNASSWATVTPVVLPGYDDPDHLRRRAKQKSLTADQQQHVLDRLAKRVDGLLRKAIVQAGFSEELAKHAGLDWRAVGFLPGTDLANRYGVPDYLKRFPRLHVRIEWRDSAGKPVQVPGPICIGGGRYFGLGLFVPINAGGQS